MASLTDGLGQSVIARLPEPPDVTTGESGITSLFGGLVSGYASGKQFVQDRREFKDAKDQLSAMVGKNLTNREAKRAGLVKPSLLESFAGGVVRTRGVMAAGADPLADLRRKAFEQNIELGDLEIESAIRKRDDEIISRRAVLELGKFMSDSIRAGTASDPETRARLGEFFTRYPESLKFPEIVQQLQLFQQSQTLEMQVKKQRQAAEEAAAGAAEAKAKGLVPSGITVGPGGVSRSFEPRATTGTAASTVGKMIEDRNMFARQGASPATLATLDRAIQNAVNVDEGLSEPERARIAAAQGLEASGVDTQGRTLYSRPRSGEEFSITTAEGTQIVRRSGSAVGAGEGIAGEPTVASKSRVQEDLAQAQKMIVDLDAFQEGLKEGHLGIRGVLGDAVFDRMLPMFGVPTADAARIESREELRLLIQGALRQVSVDSRFSNEDMKAVKLAMPSTGMVESTERANIIVDVLRRIMAKRALIDAESVGAPPPAFALGALANEALLDAVKQGIVTVEEAKAEIDRRRKTE